MDPDRLRARGHRRPDLDRLQKCRPLLGALYRHLGGGHHAGGLPHVPARFPRQKDLQHPLCHHHVLRRRPDPHLPAHQQPGPSGFDVGRHPARRVQRLEHDHCAHLLPGRSPRAAGGLRCGRRQRDDFLLPDPGAHLYASGGGAGPVAVRRHVEQLL